MATQDFKSPRCIATIPTGPQDGVTCNGLASVLTETGPMCSECFTEFGGVIVEGPEQITVEQAATDERFLSVHLLEIAVPVHQRKEPKPFDLGSLMCLVIDRVTGGEL